MSFNTNAIYDLAIKATQNELIELIESEYDNLMYLGTILEEYDESEQYSIHCKFLQTQIQSSKETLRIYRKVFDQREHDKYLNEHLKILNDPSIPIVPLE